MIFDFEPQHPDQHFDTIQKMIRYFNQSDERGKLFINYPMMQSYRHLKLLPDQSFLTSILLQKDFRHYKQIVSNESFNNDVSSYNYPTFMSLAYHHLLKLISIQKRELAVPSLSDYEKIDYAKIFDIQYANLQEGFIWILNTCIIILIDYQPSFFFDKVQKHQTSFMLPL